MPTFAPSAASASARLTAVVLLPTPPLPDATATMFLTFGSSCTPRWTACGVTFVARFALTFATSGSVRAAAISALRSAGIWLFAGIAEFDVEGDVAAFDAQVLDLPGRDEILAGVRVDDALQRIEQRGFVDRHGGQRMGRDGAGSLAWQGRGNALRA